MNLEIKPDQTTEKTVAIRIRDVPAELHQAFRIKCIRERRSMQKILMEMIRRYVSR